MSLGSEYPELFDEAMRKALAPIIVGKVAKSWHTPADQDRMVEEVEYTLSEMQWPRKDDPGAYMIYDFLTGLPGVGNDALDRFHEHWR